MWSWRLGSLLHIFHPATSRPVQTHSSPAKGRRGRGKQKHTNPWKAQEWPTDSPASSTDPKKSKTKKKIHIYPFSLSNFQVPWESVGIQGNILKQANSTVDCCWLQNTKRSHIFFCISGHFFLGLLAILSYLLNLSSVNCPWAESLNPFSIHSLLNFSHLVS